LLVEVEGEEADTGRPLLGLGIARGASPIRFGARAAQRILQEASAWCKDPKKACRGVAAESMQELSRRRWRVEEELQITAIVRQAMTPLAEQPPLAVVGGFAILVSGEEQRIVDVEVDTEKATGAKATELELPGSLHYLLVKTPTAFRRLTVIRDFDFGLGEAGELVGAVDIDQDGTDELILEWHYSEGRSWQLARREGDQLLVVGSFTDGA
jgi:hypothetical protein